VCFGRQSESFNITNSCECPRDEEMYVHKLTSLAKSASGPMCSFVCESGLGFDESVISVMD
jgi:hypothetical protein